MGTENNGSFTLGNPRTNRDRCDGRFFLKPAWLRRCSAFEEVLDRCEESPAVFIVLLPYASLIVRNQKLGNAFLFEPA